MDSISFSLVPNGSLFWDPEELAIFAKTGERSVSLVTKMPGMPYAPGTLFPVWVDKAVRLAEEARR